MDPDVVVVVLALIIVFGYYLFVLLFISTFLGCSTWTGCVLFYPLFGVVLLSDTTGTFTAIDAPLFVVVVYDVDGLAVWLIDSTGLAMVYNGLFSTCCYCGCAFSITIYYFGGYSLTGYCFGGYYLGTYGYFTIVYFYDYIYTANVFLLILAAT